MLIEQNLGLVGAVGCMFAMFIQNPAFSLVAIFLVVMIYGVLLQSKLPTPFADVLSGLFVAVAEWAAKKVSNPPSAAERTWQPNLLVPVETPRELRRSFRLLYSIAWPKGTIKILGLTPVGEQERLRSRLPTLTEVFRKQGVFASFALMDSADLGAGNAGLAPCDAAAESRGPPHATGCGPCRGPSEDSGEGRDNNVGILLFAKHQAAGLGLEKSINLWVHTSQ